MLGQNSLTKAHVSARESHRRPKRIRVLFRQLWHTERDRLSCQRLQECNEIAFLLRRQIQRLDEGAQIGIAPAALIHKFDDLFQRFKRAIVHIRSGFCDATERRRFKCAPVFLRPADSKTPKVFLHRTDLRHAEVVKLIIGEVRPIVAEDATSLALKKGQSSNRRLIHGFLRA